MDNVKPSVKTYFNTVNTTALLRRGVMLFTLAITLLGTNLAQAHAPQENYVWLNIEADRMTGRFEVNVKDVNSKLGIDVDAAGATRLEGMAVSADEIEAFLKANFSFSDGDGEITYHFTESDEFEENGNFLRYNFETDRLPTSNILTVNNSIWITPEYLKDDRLHRSLLVVEHNVTADKEFGLGNVALVFGPGKLVQEIDMDDPGSVLVWQDFFMQGILHIGIGLDHILFIVVLLLTTVVTINKGVWEPVSGFRSALWKTVKIVTIFTIAHSITLSLAALNLVNISPTIVESIIAASIIAVALNNIFPRFQSHAWVLIFTFGLFHGLGFASVMGDLQFRNILIERILIMFNVGVEVGQFVIVLVVFPILFAIRKKPWYRTVVVNSLSALAIVISVYWVGERTGIISV